MDRRDDLTWIIVELSPQGEVKVEEGVLEQTLRRDLRVGSDFPVFVPAVTYRRGNRKTTIRLLEGYVFLGSGLPDVTYYGLENRSYVEKVMSTITGPYKLRTLNTIPNSNIEDLKKKLRKNWVQSLLLVIGSLLWKGLIRGWKDWFKGVMRIVLLSRLN